MGNMVSFGNAKLPSVASLATSLRSIQTGVNAGGEVILKMDKTGHWVYGGDATEIEDDSLWAVNPFSFTHGFIAWGKGEPLGEIAVPVSEPLPELGPPPVGAERGWEPQVTFMLQCLNGEDKGLSAKFATTSRGGRSAAQTLALAIAEAVQKDQTRPVAVVALSVDSYPHKLYGKVLIPIFTIKDWVGLDGQQNDAAVEKAAAPETPASANAGEAPRRRRRA